MRARQEIVEELIFMLDEHQCCADQALLDDLVEEARREGWKLTERPAFGGELHEW